MAILGPPVHPEWAAGGAAAQQLGEQPHARKAFVAANLVDKLMKGSKPRDLSAERPTTFERVCHLKTAQALGLTLSPRLQFSPEEVCP